MGGVSGGCIFRWSLEIHSNIIPPHARVKVNDTFHQHGIDLDLSDLEPENLEDLIYQLKELTVDIDDEPSKVRVFSE
jgi:hypothetical protein